MESLVSLQEKGIIPKCYQTRCECGHDLYTNVNKTEVMCISEQCIFRGGNKLAYALKILGVKNIGVQKSISLVEVPGIRTHMDLFGIKDNIIRNTERNILSIPIIPIGFSKDTRNFVFIIEDRRYTIEISQTEYDKYVKSNLYMHNNANQNLDILYKIILPHFKTLGINIYDNFKENKYNTLPQIAKWIDIMEKYPNILAIRDTQVSVKSENEFIITSQIESRTEITLLDSRTLTSEEIEILDIDEIQYYEPTWILSALDTGYYTFITTLNQEVNEDNLDNTLDSTLLTSMYKLSKTILNDGIYLPQLNPIISKMNEMNSTTGIYLYKFIQMWNFSTIGETISQKIFMEFTTMDEFYKKFTTEKDMARFIGSKLGIAAYSDTVLNICNTLHDFKEDILRSATAFKFRPAVKGTDPILVTITNSINMKNPDTGKTFSPRESFIDYCVEKYGVPIIYKKTYTSELQYIIADDRSGNNSKLKHTDKIISSEDFVKLLEVMSSENKIEEDNMTDGVYGDLSTDILTF